MKIADIKALPQGTPLRTTRGDIVTLAAIGTSRVVVRDAGGHTHEYAGVSLHPVPEDPYPLATGPRRGLTGRTITVERLTRALAHKWRPSVPDWESLIGRPAAVERVNGVLREAHEFENPAYATGIEEVAQIVARQIGARYVPPGSLNGGEAPQAPQAPQARALPAGRPVTVPAARAAAAAAPATAQTSFGKRIRIGGHIYTVMGGSPSPYLLHRGPVEPVDRAEHRTCGSDCTVRGF